MHTHLNKWQWIKLDNDNSDINIIARSSHKISVVKDNLYCFGGEFNARIPINNDKQSLIFNHNILTYTYF